MDLSEGVEGGTDYSGILAGASYPIMIHFGWLYPACYRA